MTVGTSGVGIAVVVVEVEVVVVVVVVVVEVVAVVELETPSLGSKATGLKASRLAFLHASVVLVKRQQMRRKIFRWMDISFSEDAQQLRMERQLSYSR